MDKQKQKNKRLYIMFSLIKLVIYIAGMYIFGLKMLLCLMFASILAQTIKTFINNVKNKSGKYEKVIGFIIILGATFTISYYIIDSNSVNLLINKAILILINFSISIPMDNLVLEKEKNRNK